MLMFKTSYIIHFVIDTIDIAVSITMSWAHYSNMPVTSSYRRPDQLQIHCRVCVKTNRYTIASDYLHYVYGPGQAKTCLIPYTNNKGADQPANPRSLISTFVVRFLDNIIPLFSISEISSL